MKKYWFCLLLLLWLPVSSSLGQVAPLLGSWRQSGIKWSKPPAELNLDERSGEAGLLYFGPDGQFALVYGIVIQGRTWENLSHGDGRVVYLGTWKVNGASYRVEYRLVSRTFLKQNESLPGPVETRDIQFRGGVLRLDGKRFRRDHLLDQQLRDVFEGETARLRQGQGKF